MRIRTLAATAMALAAATAFGSPAVATAAEDSANAVEWSVEHGTASAGGERWIEDSGLFSSTLVVEGEMTNTGDDCYTLWFQYSNDLLPPRPIRNKTLCGPGSTQISYRRPYTLSDGLSVAICKGQTVPVDCGAWESLTWWPVGD